MAKNQAKDLRKLQEAGFALIELNLFLDTHPDDEEALKRLSESSASFEKLKEEYEMKHTLISAASVKSAEDQDKWLNDPWPWEPIE